MSEANHDENVVKALFGAAYYENLLDHTNIGLLVEGGLGNASTFGNYRVDTTNACLSYFANAVTGDNLDTVSVEVCDNDLNICHTINYIASIVA